MQSYFAALVMLSIAAFIEGRSSTAGLRPSHPPADRAFRNLGRVSLAVWLGMLAWGAVVLPWWQPLAGIGGSLAANALVLQAGPRPGWPGMAMALALAGLGAASWTLSRHF
jgi:hypothetical protein